MINMENREENINLIAGRIMDEYRKHSSLDWHKIAASKIHSQWFEYYEKQNKVLSEQFFKIKEYNVELKSQIALLEVQLKSSKQDVEILKSELKAADSVNENLSNLIKDVYDKTDNVKIFLLIEERLESNDLMNIILPNQPK